MARSTYSIAIVKRGKERLWRDFWTAGDLTEELKAANIHGELGQTVMVEAANLNEAILIAQKENPSFSIMREASSKVG